MNKRNDTRQPVILVWRADFANRSFFCAIEGRVSDKMSRALLEFANRVKQFDDIVDACRVMRWHL
jgi:hypothetical protein